MQLRFPLLIFSFFLTILLTAQKIEPVVQFGHVGRTVTEMVYSNDGTMLATTDGLYLKLWNMNSGLEFRAFTRADKGFCNISNITFSPDDRQIVYQANQKIFFRSIEDGSVAQEIELASTDDDEENDEDGEKDPSPEKVNAYLDAEKYLGLAFIDNSTSVAATNKKLEIRSYPDNRLIRTLKIKQEKKEKKKKNKQAEEEIGEDYIIKLFSSMLKTPLAASSTNGDIFFKGKIYDSNSGTEKLNLVQGKKDFYLRTGVFSPDGSKIAIGGIVVDTTKPTNERDYFAYWKKTLRQINGDTIGQTFSVYNALTGAILFDKNVKGTFSVQFSPDGKKIITGHGGHELNIWDAETGENILIKKVQKTKEVREDDWWSQFNFAQPVGATTFTPNSQNFIARGDQKELKSLMVWDTNTGKPVRNLGANIPPIRLEGQNAKADSIVLKEFVETGVGVMGMTQRLDKGFRLLNLANGQVPHAYARYDSILFSPFGGLYCLKKSNEDLRIIESDLGLPVCTLKNSQGFTKVIFSKNGRKIAATNGTAFKIWETQSGGVLMQQKQDGGVAFLSFDVTGNYIVGLGREKNNAVFWSIEQEDIVREYKQFTLPNFESPIPVPRKQIPIDNLGNILNLINPKGFYDVDISNDGKMAAIWLKDLYGVWFVDLDRKKTLRKHRDINSLLMQKLLLGSLDADKMKEVMENGSEDSEFALPFPINFEELMFRQIKENFNLKNFSAVSPDFRFFAKATKRFNSKKKNRIKIIPIRKKKDRKDKSLKNKIILTDSEDYQKGLTFSPDGKYIAASDVTNNRIRLWDTKTGDIYQTLEGHSGKIAFGPRGKTLISSGWDRQVKIWNIEENKPIYTFIGIQGTNDYVILLPSGHYATSRRNSKAVAFRKGKEVFPFEQFDIQFQRRDKVLRTIAQNRINFTEDQPVDECLAEAYEQAYQQRLKTYGLSESDFDKELAVPAVTIENMPLSSQNKTIQFNIDARDEQHQLDWLKIYVNDVPLYGKSGKDLRSQSSRTYRETIPLTLSNDENKIQVSVINSAGVESVPTTHQVTYTGSEVKPNLYLVTLGATDFQQGDDKDLLYPVSDLNTIVQTFKNNNQQHYNLMSPLKLHDSEFTTANLKLVEQYIGKATVDDIVLIFSATHGLLDQKYNYYLATYDTDFANPQATAIPYERLENLLDKTKARNKVLFLDACYANERAPINDEFVEKGSSSCFGNESYFDLMKTLFVDLRQGTGATIIASSRGTEQAQESKAWGTSVFTKALLESIVDGNANFNHRKENKVTVSELQTYVSKRVKQLTEGEQRPLHRIENIDNDFTIWTIDPKQ